MKRYINPFLLSGALLLGACGASHNNAASTANKDSSHVVADTATVATKTYDIALIDNKKDPTCGMPTSAGVSDTAHYQNKVIGFCSTECKNEFLKNPIANIKAAELK
jgi:YHS domain-containing protein